MTFSLETLEFSKLLELVSRNAQTPMGEARFADLRPKSNRTEVENNLSAISETIALNEEKQVSWSFSGLEDPSDAVAILKIKNATLEPTLLLEISRVCNQALFARSFDNDDLLPRIKKPVLITHNSAETVVKPSAVDEHLAAMPHAQVHWTKEAGHAPFWDDAAGFNKRLREFVAHTRSASVQAPV